MKTRMMLATLAVVMSATNVKAQQVKYPWQDTKLPRAERVENLLGMLTPEEKVHYGSSRQWFGKAKSQI